MSGFGVVFTETGHRDTACFDTAKLDMRAVGPGANSLGDAHPRQGVCVFQRREHSRPVSPRCTELALIQAGTLHIFQEDQVVAARLLHKQRDPWGKEDERCSVHNGTLNNTADVL